jgi:hypothetical protein
MHFLLAMQLFVVWEPQARIGVFEFYRNCFNSVNDAALQPALGGDVVEISKASHGLSQFMS